MRDEQLAQSDDDFKLVVTQRKREGLLCCFLTHRKPRTVEAGLQNRPILKEDFH